MRTQILLFTFLLAVGSAQAAIGSGTPDFVQITAPEGLGGRGSAGEPTIGINWDSDVVMYKSGGFNTYRIEVDAVGGSTWQDVSPLVQSPLSADPMLHTDPVTGRTWTGTLVGPCSIMQYSDDDGETWAQAGNICTGAQFDHQSIGSGPWANGTDIGSGVEGAGQYDHAVYYCGQFQTTACITSLDGGLTWGPPVQVTGGCGGLHGHIRVSPITGTAVVPDNTCDDGSGTGLFVGDHAGFGYTVDNGVTWQSRFAPATYESNGFDPSIGFTQESGWMYYGHANQYGAAIAFSKDEGQTWENLGDGMGIEATDWLDVGQFHDPPVVIATFSDVQAGDDDRVAFSFLGVEDADGDGMADEYPEDPFHTCNPEGQQMIWYYYVATSYDAGSTWTVTKITDDPVQVGGIWDGQTDDTNPETHCRNLLDFNDMDIDSKGRIYVGYADGCVGACAQDPLNAPGPQNTPGDDADGFRVAIATLAAQTSGKGLLAAYDAAPSAPGDGDLDQDGTPDDQDDDIDGDGVPNDNDENPTVFDEDQKAPASGALFAMAVLGAALFLRRRF